ncbi:MAG TPA: hypothetical protein VF789_26400 [Thermoanaerobaculia bacterium]
MGGLLALAAPAAGGEFRFLVEGELGAQDEGGYGDEQDVAFRQDDPIARAGVNLQLSYALQRLSLALDYSPSYERNLEDTDLSGTTHLLDFGLVGDLTRTLQLNVREQLLSLPDLNSYQPVAAPVTYVTTPRGDQLAHSLDVSLDQAYSRRFSLSLGLSHSLRRFEEDDFVDSETLGGRMSASWELAEGRLLEALAGSSRFDYGDQGDSDVLTFGLAYAMAVGRDSLLRVEGGTYSVESKRTVLLLPPPVPGVPPGSEPEPVPAAGEVREEDDGWRGSLQFSQSRRLFRWGLGVSHDISAGAGLGRAVEADNAYVDVSWPVSRQWELGLDGNASRQTEIFESIAVDGQTLAGESLTEFVAGTARASWSFTPAFRLSGSYSRIWQSSEVEPFADLSYSRYFLSLAFRLFSAGETPNEPESLGRPIDDDEPDTH